MIKQLIKLANHLDSKGLSKEADYLDAVIRKLAINLDDIMDRPNPGLTPEKPGFNPADTATEPALQLDFSEETKPKEIVYASWWPSREEEAILWGEMGSDNSWTSPSLEFECDGPTGKTTCDSWALNSAAIELLKENKIIPSSDTSIRIVFNDPEHGIENWYEFEENENGEIRAIAPAVLPSGNPAV